MRAGLKKILIIFLYVVTLIPCATGQLLCNCINNSDEIGEINDCCKIKHTSTEKKCCPTKSITPKSVPDESSACCCVAAPSDTGSLPVTPRNDSETHLIYKTVLSSVTSVIPIVHCITLYYDIAPPPDHVGLKNIILLI